MKSGHDSSISSGLRLVETTRKFTRLWRDGHRYRERGKQVREAGSLGPGPAQTKDAERCEDDKKQVNAETMKATVVNARREAPDRPSLVTKLDL